MSYHLPSCLSLITHWHFGLLVETVLGLQPKHFGLYSDSQPIGYVVGAHSWCSKCWSDHLSTFHTNMSMIRHSFATCRACMSGCQSSPFLSFSCIFRYLEIRVLIEINTQQLWKLGIFDGKLAHGIIDTLDFLKVSPKLDAKERSEDLKDLRQGEVFPGLSPGFGFHLSSPTDRSLVLFDVTMGKYHIIAWKTLKPHPFSNIPPLEGLNTVLVQPGERWLM